MWCRGGRWSSQSPCTPHTAYTPGPTPAASLHTPVVAYAITLPLSQARSSICNPHNRLHTLVTPYVITQPLPYLYFPAPHPRNPHCILNRCRCHTSTYTWPHHACTPYLLTQPEPIQCPCWHPHICTHAWLLLTHPHLSSKTPQPQYCC